MSERKWIEVSHEGNGSEPWVMVAPVDARGNEHAPVAVNRSVLRDALRDRVADLERECAQWREHTERRGDEIDDWMGRANDLGIERDRLVRERDEARREAGEAEEEAARMGGLLGAEERKIRELREERDRFRHQLEEAESIAANQPVFAGDIIGKQSVKSLVSRGIVRKNHDGDYVLRTPGPEHSAPHDTHCVPVRVTSQLTNVPGPWEKLVEIQLPYSVGKTKATIPADMLSVPHHGHDAKEVEDWRRDAAETTHLRAENERLRQLLSGYMPEDLIGRHLADPGPHEAEDPPAPQTHYCEHDVILALDKREARLRRLVEAFDDDAQEVWDLEDGSRIHLTPGCVPILERDGIPTDAGLRRLAERAGLALYIVERQAMVRGFRVGKPNVVMTNDATDNDRRALAAALREMGGA